MSKTEIIFFGTLVFKVDNKLQKRMYVKPTSRQRYLYSKSEYPNSTKKSIAYSQALNYSGWGGKKAPPTSISPITSTNVGFSPKNFLIFSFNPFATLL